ncbi:ATP-binding protein [Massilia sp. Dwa41.01b]|uniref:sensor histidine kinase n=1 Tax=Massilia sp. Dwa41.01b TaxID=2709302 RepID=UPI0016005F12|nr:ATP-binding protein [Massilia sp. Dwa41.01b]QNA89035.1 ATP-binding protein [Massilia sp. Dwa41.01b]
MERAATAMLEEYLGAVCCRIAHDPSRPFVIGKATLTLDDVGADSLTRLAQAIGNIPANAVKYTPPAGTIRVRVAREDGHALVHVDDDGPGMSAGTLAQLFALFVRGSERAADAPGRLGVGMWITRQLVEAHGGSVRAAMGGPGRGSAFTIVLPLAPGARRLGRAGTAPGRRLVRSVRAAALFNSDPLCFQRPVRMACKRTCRPLGRHRHADGERRAAAPPGWGRPSQSAA